MNDWRFWVEGLIGWLALAVGVIGIAAILYGGMP